MRTSEPVDNWEMRDVVITFRESGLAHYNDRWPGQDSLDVSLPTDPLARYTVEFLRRQVESTDESNCGELLAVLGRHLFEFVFGPNPERNGNAGGREDAAKARRRFEQMLTWAKEKDHFVNLRLNFERNAQALAVWPWEFLWYPGGSEGWDGYFLRTQHVSVLRDVYSQRNMDAGDPPVKVLLATSGPKDAPGIGANEMTDVLTPHRDAKPPRIDLHLVENKNFTALRKEIEGFSPDVFHFHGHGDGSGGLTLPHAPRKGLAEFRFTSELQDTGVDTQGQTVASLFSQYQPQLVLITACDSALDDVPFADVAQQLAMIGIPAVAAMQFKLRPATATLFAEEFYNALINGALIAPAFAAGLNNLTDENATQHGSLSATRDFGTPVLFLNSTESRLVVRGEKRRGGGSGPDTRIERNCAYCGFVGPAGKYCGGCGRELICGGCDNPIVAAVTFCTNCKRKIPDPPPSEQEPAQGHQSGGGAPNLRVVQPAPGVPVQGDLTNPHAASAGQ